MFKVVAIVLATMFSSTAFAAEYEIGQHKKQFTTKELKIKVGDTVKFTNNDPFFHNVFSLSETITFDLGSYPKGKFKKVTFEKPGTVEIECAIHPNMTAIIIVE